MITATLTRPPHEVALRERFYKLDAMHESVKRQPASADRENDELAILLQKRQVMMELNRK